MKLIVGCLFLLSLTAHSAPSPTPDDALRLDPRIRPITESLDLQLDPAADGYSGTARIELNFEISTNRFRFHALEVDLGRATLDGQSLALIPGEAAFVTATAESPATVGPHVFEVAFTNNFNRDGTGLYKTVTEGRSYLFTQMEPADARRAFPCWDEPGFKMPWRLTVTVPNDLETIANMPVAMTTEKGDRKIVEFGRTPPMSSYLVALAVGPFEYVPIIGQTVPGRIYTLPGKTGLARMAAEEAPALLSALERYFGTPYPYPKLDQIAVPEFNFGAMENPGLITYRDSFLLLNSTNFSVSGRQSLISIMAHEMAHMWFGNLVTMGWWDDLWLNEAFATWMSFKIAAQVHPDLEFEDLALQSAGGAVGNDAQPSVKPVRRPFRGGDNLQEAFDSLSYQKGHAILRMIEGWIGDANMKAGLKRYLTIHRWGNTRADDLWNALGEGDDSTLPNTLRRYLEQPGIPELTFTALPGDRLQVRQRRYRFMTAKGVAEQIWRVPIVLRIGDSSGSRTVRLLLENEDQVFPVAGLDKALWVYPNSGQTGHYVWSLSPDLGESLTRHQATALTKYERLDFLSTADGAMMSGNLSSERRLQINLALARDPELKIRTEVAATVANLEHFLAPADTPITAELIRRVLRPMLDELGLEPKPGDSAERESFRNLLLHSLGTDGSDPDVIEFCRKNATRVLSDPASVKASIAWVSLSVATWHGDPAWSDRLRTAFEQAKEPKARGRLLGCLARFHDPVLARAGMTYGLTEAVRPTEFLGVLGGKPASVPFEWLVENYEAVARKVPKENLPALVRVLGDGDAALLARGRAFFLDPSRRDPLTELRLTEVSDSIELMTALRDGHGAGLARYIQTYLRENLGR